MRALKLVACMGALSLSLLGCGGSSSDPIKEVTPPVVVPPVATSITSLNLAIQDVNYQASSVELTVLALNQDGASVVGLTDLEVKTVAQLVPQGASGAGNGSFWQSLYDAKKNPSTHVDNQDGTYSFTIPLVGLDLRLDQRFTFIAGGKKSLLANGKTKVAHQELVADFSSQGNAIDSGRQIVSQTACTQCHAEDKPFARRHTSYLALDTCISCHSGQEGGAQWNSLIHNIHNAAQSFTDKKGNEYTGVTAQALVDNQCQKCHQADNSLPQWNNFAQVPTMETCSSCHAGIDFKAGKGHPQQDDNANCVACHNSEWTTEIHSQSRTNKAKLALGYQVKAQMQVNADSTVTLNVSVLDKDDKPVDIETLVPSIYRFKASTNLGPNSPCLDYKAIDNIKLVKDGKLDKNVILEAGSVIYITKALPFASGDADTAFSFIGLSLCHDQGLLVECNPEGTSLHTGTKAALAFATYSGDQPSRRQARSIEFARCESCHGDTFDVHGNYIVNPSMGHQLNGKSVLGVEACATCHTHGETKTLVDGSYLGAIELRVHQTHNEKASGLTMNDANNCVSCHEKIDTAAFAKKSAISTGKKLYTTPITAVCSSCHGLETEEMAHSNVVLEGFGAVVNGDKKAAADAAQLETCFNCHAPTLTDHTKIGIQ